MLHLGLVKPQIRDNTDIYRGLVKSVIIITVLDAIILGIFSFIINLFIGNVGFNQLLIFLIIPTVACIGAVSISIPITSILAIETYKRGLDPDILVYPILASINDFVVTVFFMLTVFTVLKGGFYFTVLVTIYIVILAIISYIGYIYFLLFRK